MSLCPFCPYDLRWVATSSKEETFPCRLQTSVQPTAPPGYSKMLNRKKEKKQVPVDKYKVRCVRPASHLWNQMYAGTRKVTHPKTKVLSQIQFTYTWKKRVQCTWCLHSTIKVILKVPAFSSTCYVRPTTMPETIKMKLNSDIGSLVIESYLKPCWASVCKLSSLGFLPTDGGNQMWLGLNRVWFLQTHKIEGHMLGLLRPWHNHL